MKLRHPISGSIYASRDDGRVLVEDAEGRSGLFEPNGRWLRGELREADPQLTGFVSGRELSGRRSPTTPCR